MSAQVAGAAGESRFLISRRAVSSAVGGKRPGIASRGDGQIVTRARPLVSDACRMGCDELEPLIFSAVLVPLKLACAQVLPFCRRTILIIGGAFDVDCGKVPRTSSAYRFRPLTPSRFGDRLAANESSFSLRQHFLHHARTLPCIATSDRSGSSARRPAGIRNSGAQPPRFTPRRRELGPPEPREADFRP
jgi:hypothetical protein